MAGVFVSYRWVDQPLGAATVYHDLERRLGRDHVFRDRERIGVGERYPDVLREHLERVDVLVCVIGPHWPQRAADGSRLIDDPSDWVRLELTRAFQRGIDVIPVLLKETPDDGELPTTAALPAEIRELALRRPLELRQSELRAGLDLLAERILAKAPGLVIPQLFAGVPDRDPLVNAPSTLLRPEFRVVPFTGRDGELADLREWVAGPTSLAAGVVTGPPGVGRSRLVVELCAELRADGWLTGIVAGDAPAEQIRRTADLDRPLLAVVDDAELRAEQLVAIAAAMCDRAAARRAPARLLLVGQAAGAWPERLVADADERVRRLIERMDARAVVQLRPVGDRAGAHRAALAAFAAELDRPVPHASPPAGASLLEIHAVALDQVLGGPGTGDVLDRVLAHDRRRLRDLERRTGARHLPIEPLAVIGAVATLCAANSGDRSAAVRGRLPELLPGIEVEPYLKWYAALYPGRHEPSAVGPAHYGERLVVRALAGTPDLPAALARCCTDDQLRDVLTVLGRAVPRHPELAPLVTGLLMEDLPRLLLPGIDAADRLEEPTPFVRAVAAALETAPQPPPDVMHALMVRVSGSRRQHLGPLRATVLHRWTKANTALFESMTDRPVPPQLRTVKRVADVLGEVVLRTGMHLLDPQRPAPAKDDGTPYFPERFGELVELLQQWRRTGDPEGHGR
ncbi:MAG TPA: toll/interleukin-1 receptor domain-containing protein [Pseudonocardiaceae bacterium]